MSPGGTDATFQQLAERARQVLIKFPAVEQINKLKARSPAVAGHFLRLRKITESIGTAGNLAVARPAIDQLRLLTVGFDAGIQSAEFWGHDLFVARAACALGCRKQWSECAAAATGGGTEGEPIPIENVDIEALAMCDLQYGTCLAVCFITEWG